MFPLAFELRQDVTLGFGEPQAASGIERSFSWVTGTGLTTCLVPGLHEGLSSFSLPWEELAVQIERGFVYSVFSPWPIWLPETAFQGGGSKLPLGRGEAGSEVDILPGSR